MFISLDVSCNIRIKFMIYFKIFYLYNYISLKIIYIYFKLVRKISYFIPFFIFVIVMCIWKNCLLENI